MKVLITGSDGLIGSNILPFLGRHFDVVPALEKDWDITDRQAGSEVMQQVRPDVVLNLAAMTNVEACEDSPEKAFRVNGEGPGTLAILCNTFKARLVHFSTDYVFDGAKHGAYTEDDATNPLSVYGKSKLLGEKNVLETAPSSAVIRTAWIYGRGGENFITKILSIARETGRIEVVDDQWGAPTYARDLGPPVVALVQGQKTGIYHVTNNDSCTWYGFAVKILSLLDMKVVCRATTSDRLARRAKRPANSVLDCGKLRTNVNIAMRSWDAALREYLACLA